MAKNKKYFSAVNCKVRITLVNVFNTCHFAEAGDTRFIIDRLLLEQIGAK